MFLAGKTIKFYEGFDEAEANRVWVKVRNQRHAVPVVVHEPKPIECGGGVTMWVVTGTQLSAIWRKKED